MTRPFRYDPNQIPYDYTVKVRNRFEGLDLIERMPEELQMEVSDIIQEAVIKTIPKKKKCKKAKCLSEEALKIAEKRREAKGKGEKERYTCLNAEFQKQHGAIRKPSLVTNAKKLRKTIESEKAMAPHSSTLAWKTSWTEEPGGLQSMGSHRVGHD